jgi:hypothetical protein
MTPYAIDDRVRIVAHPDSRIETKRVGASGTIVGGYAGDATSGHWYDVHLDGETLDGKPFTPVYSAAELEPLDEAPTLTLVEDES